MPNTKLTSDGSSSSASLTVENIKDWSNEELECLMALWGAVAVDIGAGFWGALSIEHRTRFNSHAYFLNPEYYGLVATNAGLQHFFDLPYFCNTSKRALLIAFVLHCSRLIAEGTFERHRWDAR